MKAHLCGWQPAGRCEHRLWVSGAPCPSWAACPLRTDEQQLWPGTERAWGVPEAVGAGQPEDLRHSQGGKETGRKLRAGQAEETGCRGGTEPTPSPG